MHSIPKSSGPVEPELNYTDKLKRDIAMFK